MTATTTTTGLQGAIDRFGGRTPLVRRLTLAGIAVAVLALVATLTWGPIQTYRQQQARTAEAEAELAGIDDEIEQLDSRVAALDDDAEIEAIAREEYNLVRPGEQAYALLPGAPVPLPVPDAWPFTNLRVR